MFDLFILLAMILMFIAISQRLSSTEELLTEALRKLNDLKRNSVDKEDHYKLMNKITDIEYDLRGIEIELKYSA